MLLLLQELIDSRFQFFSYILLPGFLILENFVARKQLRFTRMVEQPLLSSPSYFRHLVGPLSHLLLTINQSLKPSCMRMLICSMFLGVDEQSERA